jgi:hypothetical protein
MSYDMSYDFQILELWNIPLMKFLEIKSQPGVGWVVTRLRVSYVPCVIRTFLVNLPVPRLSTDTWLGRILVYQ